MKTVAEGFEETIGDTLDVTTADDEMRDSIAPDVNAEDTTMRELWPSADTGKGDGAFSTKADDTVASGIGVSDDVVKLVDDKGGA